MGIRARNLDQASAARYVNVEMGGPVTLTGTGSALAVGVWPYGQRSPPFGGTAIQSQYEFAKIVDVVLAQTAAGVGGTSFTVNVLVNGVTIFTTNAVVTLASGANVSTDAKGELTLPAGWTRPVLVASNNANLFLKKGDSISVTYVVTGTYTTAAQFIVSVIVDPNPV